MTWGIRGIDERVGRHVEIVTQLPGVRVRDARGGFQLEQRSEHVPQPGVALRRPDDKGGMAHAQPRVAPLLAVRRGPTPVLHQEQCEVARRLGEVVGVQRAQQRVAGDAEVEAIDQIDEERLTSHPLVQCVHRVESRGFRLSPDSRP